MIFKYQNIKKKLGFTLVELIIVIAIITLLAGIVVVTLNPVSIFQSSRNSQRANDISTIQSAISRYLGETKITGTTRSLSDLSGYDNLTISSNAVGNSYSPIAYWHLDGSGNILNGNTLPDSTVNALNLIANNANATGMIYAGGVISNSVKMDGVDDFLSTTADSDLLDIRTGSKTWSMWFNTTIGSGFEILARKSDAANGNGVIIDIGRSAPGKVQCSIGLGLAVNVISTNSYNDGKWHNLICSLDRVQNLLFEYIDGVSAGNVSSSSLGVTDLNATTSLYLGFNSSQYVGQIDDVFVSNTPFTATDALNVYNNPAEGICMNGNIGNNLTKTTTGFDLDTTGSTFINLSVLLNNGYLPKIPKDPLDGSDYRGCLDLFNNKFVIFSPKTEGGGPIKYVSI